MNSYLTETSALLELVSDKDSQGSEMHISSTSAQPNEFNDQRTNGLIIDETGMTSLPSRQ